MSSELPSREIEDLKKNYPEPKAAEMIDDIELEKFIKNFYGNEEPKYPNNQSNNLLTIHKQAKLICNHMDKLGLRNFSQLIKKFPATYQNLHNPNIGSQIKKSMEAILFSIEKPGFDKAAFVQQYKDRTFVCNEGTLSNLQTVLSEVQLGKTDLKAYIGMQKREYIEQISTDLYRKGFYKEVFRGRSSQPYEIHNINSLVNSVADEFGLNKKTRKDDTYLVQLRENTASHLSSCISEGFLKQNTADLFADGIASKILIGIPSYNTESYSSKAEYANEVQAYLDTVGIGINNNAIVGYKDGEYDTEIKPNIHQILKDAVTVKLDELNLFNSQEIDKAKMRLDLESSTDSMVLSNKVSEEALNSSKEKGLLDEALKYCIKNNLSLDEEELGTENPILYGIKHNIDIGDPQRLLIEKYEIKASNARNEEEERAIQLELDKESKQIAEILGIDHQELQKKRYQVFLEDIISDQEASKLIGQKNLKSIRNELDSGSLENLPSKIEEVRKDLEKKEKISEKDMKQTQKLASRSKIKNLQKTLHYLGKSVASYLTGKQEKAKENLEMAKKNWKFFKMTKNEKKMEEAKASSKHTNIKKKRKFVDIIKGSDQKSQRNIS